MASMQAVYYRARDGSERVSALSMRHVPLPRLIGPSKGLVQWLWLRTWMLLRELAGGTSVRGGEDPNALARVDDVLDAWLDDDGMDATGL